MCKFCAEIHLKRLPKGSIFIYLEDAGIIAVQDVRTEAQQTSLWEKVPQTYHFNDPEHEDLKTFAQL